jgi:hypothetical protein
MPSKHDLLLDDIFQVLPCDSIADIAKKTKASKDNVRKAIAYLRKHPYEYGWTIPHVSNKRVEDDPTQKGKYFYVILEKDGSTLIDADKRLHYTRGAHTSLSCIATMLANEAQALLSCSKNERSPAKRYMLESIVKDMLFLQDKTKHAAAQFGT